MADLFTDIAEAAEALCDPRHHAEPRYEWTPSRHRKPIEPHKTIVPGLIQQLRDLTEPGASGDDTGIHTVPASRPPGDLNAVSLLAAISFGAARRLTNPVGQPGDYGRGLGQPLRDTPEANIRAIVGALKGVDENVQREIRSELRSWQAQAEVITGWADAPVELVAPCPIVDTDGRGTPCGARGTLLARADASGARCTACGSEWDADTAKFLFAEVAKYRDRSLAAAADLRAKVRAEKHERRDADERARESRRTAA